MNETLNIEAKLIGSEETKRRRAELLADLSGALAEGGPQAVTGEMTRRMDTLAEAFAGRLKALRKIL